MSAVDLEPVLHNNNRMATPRKRPPKHKPESPKETPLAEERAADRHKDPHIGFNLEQELVDLVDADAGEGDRTRAAQLRQIVKEHYRSRGLWHGKPPPA